VMRGILRAGCAVLAGLLVVIGFAGCGGSGRSATEAGVIRGTLAAKDRPPVVLGVGRSPEQRLLGELYRRALETQGFHVRVRGGLPSLAAIHAAFLRGEIELYVADVGAFKATIAHDATKEPNAIDAYASVEGYAFGHHYRALPPTPFAVGGALVVTDAFARRHRIRSIGDLRSVRRVRLGLAPAGAGSRASALATLHAYGIANVAVLPLRGAGWDRALAAGAVDVAGVEATDWRLDTPSYRTLADPRHALGFHNLALVVSADLLTLEGPTFAPALDGVTRRLTTRAVRSMKRSLVRDHEDLASVAARFLGSHRGG
jgi:osmoprotectant transport system substrate-binding protein